MSTNHAIWGMSYSMTFRELATAAAQRAVADLENPLLAKHEGRDGCPMTHTPRAAEAVILAVTALEAGVNEMLAWVGLGFVPSLEPLPEGYERSVRLTDKWSLLPRIVVGNVLDRGSPPWQDFSALVGLRDALIHFKWRDRQVPNFMRSLHARDLTIPEDPAIYWVDAALTDRVAVWAVSTCDRMFAAMATLLGRTNAMDWPWQ